ncbi:MAG: Crp/Fnr family transcriptional regulator [Burkholderiaceae bacterium]
MRATLHMTDADSCLVRNFSYYIDLGEEDVALLHELEEQEVALERGKHAYRRGDDLRCLHVVKTGWLYSYVDLDDGRRQIVKIHHPGDVVGFPDLAVPRATVNLMTCESAIVCPFPRRALRAAFDRCPNVAALLFTLALRDHIIMLDTIRLLGRMTARERLAFMILDLIARLRIASGDLTLRSMQIPLNQTEIGDYVGLSNVHVSRAFKAIEAAGLIEREGKAVTVMMENELCALSHFENRYLTLDTGWFLGIGADAVGPASNSAWPKPA